MPQIHVERFGDRIRIKPATFLGGEQFPIYLNAVKSLGAAFSKANKCHTLGLNLENCRELRATFGKSLVIGPELTEWARDAVAAEKALLETLALDMTTVLPIPRAERDAPTLAAAVKARGYQTIAPHFAALAGNFILADQPGLGKTIEAMLVLVETGVRGHVLVIAPKTSLRATWAAEVEKWLGDMGATAHVIDQATTPKRVEALDVALADDAPLTFVLINAEMVRLKEVHRCTDPNCEGNAPEFCNDPKATTKRESKFPALFEHRWAAILGDETHRYLINANPRARAKSQVGLGFQRLRLAEAGGVKVAMSGTPMKGKPRLLWPTLHWLRPDLYTSQWRWSKRNFKTVEDSYADSGERVTDDIREDRRESLERELDRIMLRRTKAELRAANPAWAPPEKRYAEVWLDMSPAQTRAYKAMEKNAQVRLASGTLMADGVLAELTRLRQFANCAGDFDGERFTPQQPSNKIEWLVDTFLLERGITGDPKRDDGEGKVVIASQFTSFINLMSEVLRDKGIEHYLLTGQTNKGSHFQDVQRAWQSESGPSVPRVLLLNTAAGGVSLTLDAADDMVIMDETWVPDDQEQVEDRIHRTGRTDHQVLITYVRSEGSIERILAGTNVIKDDRQKRLLDGRRGVEVAKKMMGA